MIGPNADLAYRVLDHIKAHPGMHDQTTWFRKTECGTVACFAGWAVIFAGGKVSMDGFGNWQQVILGEELYLDSFAAAGRAALNIQGDAVDEHATLCDCDDMDGCDCPASLFGAANTPDDLERYVLALFGPRPVTA